MRAHDPRAGAGPRTVTLHARDVTVAKELEEKLVQAERVVALGLAPGNVGQQICQPLSSVLASLDVLERVLASVTVDPRALSCIANIRSGTQRIADIASSLHLIAGRRPPTAAPVDVRQPLEAALNLCANQLATCVVERDVGDLPRVQGDEGELAQVFASLLLNAVEARAPEEQRTAHRITITAAALGDRVRVSVADSGVGIDAERLVHVFDPLFTTKEKAPGAALGLFIARGIVEAGGGQLAIASEPGVGTQVEVLLPIAATAQPLPREPEKGVQRAASTRKRLRVLLVDDEPRFLESLKLALEDDHTVDTEREAAQALRILESDPRRYDVVICDLAMPEVDGATFYARMGELGVADRFVLMTGGAYTQGTAEFVAAKRCPSIPKPFQLERLLELLDDFARDR